VDVVNLARIALSAATVSRDDVLRSGAMDTSDLAQLRSTLLAKGIRESDDARVTLGRAADTFLAPRPSGLPPARLGNSAEADYVLSRELGRGGMASVWLAEQRVLSREVAIKRVLVKQGDEANLLLQEAVITGQLEHPNIVPVHALVSDAEGPAVVMKRISGRSWEALIAERASLDRHLEIFLQVCNACAFAHSRGVLHRDIKPSNVMIGDFGEVYLLDWGIARRLDDEQVTQLVGTPGYLAPEMAEGLSDVRSDVFLLGATLHEAVTGKPRHAGEAILQVIAAALTCAPYSYESHVPEELAGILNRACARDPEARFDSVASLRDAILRFREHRSATLLVSSARERLELLRTLARTGSAADYARTEALFTETRFAFEQALRVWSEHPDARRGLDECLEVMIRFELERDHVDAASALLSALTHPDPALLSLVASKRQESATRASRLQKLERDRDVQFGAKARSRALIALSAAVLAMTLALFLHRLLMPSFQPSTSRLALVGAVVLTLMVGVVAWWRRKGPFNLVNARIAQICVGTLAMSFLQRVAGHLAQLSASEVLLSDAFVLGMGGFALSAFHRAGPWLVAMCLAVGFTGALLPDWIDDLFIALSVFVPLSVLLLGRDATRRGEG
jgi:serine/threonine-protein kinase